MNVNELMDKIKSVALTQKPVKSAYDGDVYDNWNSAEVQYGSVNVGLQTITTNANQVTYSVILYYGDRLLQDKGNVNSIYSDGVLALQSIINTLNTLDRVDVEESVVYTPFEQQFVDYLAGVYTTIDITCESDLGLCSIDDFNEN